MKSMIFKNIIFSVTILFVVGKANTQEIGIDRKAESIFTYYSLPDSRLELAADGNISYSLLLRPPQQIHYTLIGTHDPTVTKLRAWTLGIKLTTAENLLTSEKLSTLRPGIGIKFGWQTSIDSFNHLDTRLPRSKKSVKTYGINAIFNIDNVKLFDSSIQITSKNYPITYGVESYYNLIYKHRKDTTHAYRIILAFTASLKRTWNDDDLISYQSKSDVIIRPTVVALEDFEGRYGVLKRNITNARFSVSLPMYFQHFNPIPYFVLKSISNDSPIYYFGLFLNYINHVLDPRSFNISSSLGMGIDWKYQGSMVSNPVIFLKGEVRF